MSPRVSTGARGVDFVRHARGRLGKDEGTVPPVLEWRWGRVWNSFGFHGQSLMGQFGVELVLGLNWPQMVEFGESKVADIAFKFLLVRQKGYRLRGWRD